MVSCQRGCVADLPQLCQQRDSIWGLENPKGTIAHCLGVLLIMAYLFQSFHAFEAGSFIRLRHTQSDFATPNNKNNRL